MIMCQKTSSDKQQKKSDLNLTVSSVEQSILDLLSTDFDSISFTPTTMAKFESVFTDFNNQLAAEAAGGMPWSDGFMDGAYDTDGCEYDGSRAKIAKMEHSYNQVLTSTTPPIAPAKPPRKLPGPRPRRPIEEMTPIEAERRRRRRERNKNAATKCRHRRVEITNELLLETAELEREASQLEQEIENLRRQKTQLEFVLQSHATVCQLNPPTSNLSNSNIKFERSDSNITSFQLPHVTAAVRPNSLPISSVSSLRPTLLPVNSLPVSSAMMSYDSAFVDFTPVDILSPSAFITLSPTALL